MKLNQTTIALLLIVMTLSSCRFHEGLTSNVNQHQTQLVLSEKNYRIVKYVEGDAKALYYFGIGGGTSKRGLVARARENMLKNAGLIGKSRAVMNETTEVQYKQTFFVTEIRYIVSAHVVEFYDPSSEAAPAAEESIYVPVKEKSAPTIKSHGITAGVTLQANENRNDYSYRHSPGYHLGYLIEFSKPNINYLFWSTQINLTYLNTQSEYMNRPLNDEKTICVELPFLLGVKLPISQNFHWFAKGGPTIGVLFNSTKSHEYGYNSPYSAPSIGGELYSGFQLFKKWQLSAGHRWNIGYYDYDYSKISLTYLL